MNESQVQTKEKIKEICSGMKRKEPNFTPNKHWTKEKEWALIRFYIAMLFFKVEKVSQVQLGDTSRVNSVGIADFIILNMLHGDFLKKNYDSGDEVQADFSPRSIFKKHLALAKGYTNITEPGSWEKTYSNKFFNAARILASQSEGRSSVDERIEQKDCIKVYKSWFKNGMENALFDRRLLRDTGTIEMQACISEAFFFFCGQCQKFGQFELGKLRYLLRGK